MKKIARFIVDKRNYVLIFFLLLMVYCVWGMTKVNVEYSIESYLPQDTDTRKAIGIMEDEFTTYGTTTIMLRNISYQAAEDLHEEIKSIDGVKSFEFKNTTDYYKQSCALFNITFEGDGEHPQSVEAYNRTIDLLKDYDLLISSQLVNSYADELQQDVNFVLVLALVVIVLVLLFTSKSFMEVPVFLVTFGVAALLNMGTNYWLGTISFISNSVCVILQLALAIDYAIILCHRFSEEKAKNGGNARDAMIEALSKAFPEICGSSLTTIAGLLALTTMSLRLGADLGIVLAKSILCSMFTVFLFMPCVTLLLSRAIDKTKHRNFVPPITAIGKADVKFRYVILALFVGIVGASTYFSFQTDYVYSDNSIDTNRPSDTQIATAEIEKVFGYSNQFVILVPSGDYEMQKQLLDTVSAHEEISDALGVANVEITLNENTYYLTQQINYKQFAALLGADDVTASRIFAAYAFFSGEDTKTGLEELAVFEANREIYTASILEMCDCAFAHDDFISAYLHDNTDALKTYVDMRKMIEDAEAQLIGSNYTRMLFNIDGAAESKETFALIEDLIKEVKLLCPEAIFAGTSMSAYDLDQSFSLDNIKVSVLTILFVFIILIFSLRSWGLPLPLTLTIQGAIFINFGYYAIFGINLFFFVYLIVSAIQMGATIDYAIVLTSRYEELKKTTDKKTAVIQALNQSFPTIVTSGSIMAVAGFLIGGLVGDPLIATLGNCLGRGVIISILSVMIVLPSLLYIFDKPLSKTKFKDKLPRKRTKLRLNSNLVRKLLAEENKLTEVNEDEKEKQ